MKKKHKKSEIPIGEPWMRKKEKVKYQQKQEITKIVAEILEKLSSSRKFY